MTGGQDAGRGQGGQAQGSLSAVFMATGGLIYPGPMGRKKRQRERREDTVLTAVELRHMSEQEEGRFRWVRRTGRATLGLAVLSVPVELIPRINNEPMADGSVVTLLCALVLLAAGLALITSTVLLVRWIYQCIGHEGRLNVQGYGNKPRDIIWAFVIPFVNLVRPYEIIRRLHEASSPEGLPVSPGREEAAADYREAPRVRPRDSEAWRRSFPLLGWWMLRMLDMMIERATRKMAEPPVPEIDVNFGIMITAISWGITIAHSTLFLSLIGALHERRQERYQRLIDLASEQMA